MKTKLKRLLTLIISAVTALSFSGIFVGCAPKKADVLDKEILIGSWISYYDTDINSLDEQMKLLAESGVNFNLFPYNVESRDLTSSLDGWRYIDSLCSKYGIYYAMCGSAEKGDNLTNYTEDAYENIKAWSKEINSPYLRFVNVFDEPAEFPDPESDRPSVTELKDISEKYKKLNNGIIPFVNLLPNYAPLSSFDNYLQSYIDSCHPTYLSSDFYPFMPDDDRPRFLSYLQSMHDVAYKNGKTKLHGFVQADSWITGGKLQTRVPTVDEMRWCNYLHLCYGFKALSYFNYCAYKIKADSYSVESLIMMDGTIPDKERFDGVAELNWEIRKLSPVIMTHDVKEVYHVKEEKRQEGAKILPSDYFIRSTDDFFNNFVIAYLEPKTENTEYVMLFNDDYASDKVGEFKIDLKKLKGLSYFNPSSQELEPVQIDSNGIFEVHFNTGEGKLFKIIR